MRAAAGARVAEPPVVTVGGHISVPARIQISWDLVGQSVGPGLVDPIRPMCCR